MRKIDYEKQNREQKKEAKKIIIQNAYNDTIKHELVNRITQEEVLTQLSNKFPEIIVSAIPEIEKGLVLVNDYGHGAFQ